MSLNPLGRNGKKLWMYYNKCFGPAGEFLEKAQCVMCSKYYIYKSYDNDGSLWRHLKNAHAIERQYRDTNVKITRKSYRDLPPLPEIDEGHTEAVDTSNIKIYRYFTLYKNGRVKCRVCMSASLPTELLPNHAANMKVHLKTHPRAYRLYELEKKFGLSGPQYDEREHLPKSQSASNILRQDDGKYHCKICQKTMSGGITEMQYHLNDKHAGISKHEIGQDSIYMEVVFVGNKEKKRPITKLNLKTSVKKPMITNKLGSEGLDAFGLYVTSLLRNMPQEDCTKIQQTILNNIIEAKLKVSDKKSQNQDTSTTVTRTIKTVPVAAEDDDMMDGSENIEELADNVVPYVEDNTEKEAVTLEYVDIEVPRTSDCKRYKYAITEDVDILELS